MFWHLDKQPSPSRISCITCVLMTLCANVHASDGRVYYPPFTNLAFEKPVELYPEHAICGLSEASIFCESRTQQQNLCDKYNCALSCETGGFTSLPPFKTLLGTLSDTLPKQCGIQRSSFLAPESSVKSFEFSSSSVNASEPCYLSLVTSSLLELQLQSSWSVTLSFWIWNDLEDLQEGTLFEIINDQDGIVMKVFFSGHFLMLMSGEDLVKEPAWVIPTQQWNHVAIQIHDGATSLFLNGSLISPSQYGAVREHPATANSYTIGDSHTGGERFIGFLHDFKIYLRAVSNRDVMEIYTGTLPDTRVLSDCRCSPAYPALKDTDMSFCVQNEGEGSSDIETYRITRDSYPVEYVNDGKLDTQWISQPPTETNNAPIQETQIVVDLEEVYEVRHVEITFYSPYPSLISIERQMEEGGNFEYWQFYSADCTSYTSIPPNAVLSRADDYTCRLLVEANEVTPYSNGVKKFDILKDRPGQTGNNMFSPALREFMKARRVRITLKDYEYVTFQEHKYHSIYEIKINGTCDCSGHGTACDTSVSPYVCTCANDSYTQGRQCDECVENSYRLPDKDLYDPDLCQLCDCDLEGSVGENPGCDETTGQCDCKANVISRKCDMCAPGHFNLSHSNPDGCQACDCATEGVYNMSAMCEQLTGECQCKSNVEGDRCQSCQTDHYGLSEDNPLGCSPCDCNEAGVKDSRTDCDLDSGQCLCKTLATGLQCDECAAGYYDLDSSNDIGCSACGCNLDGAHNTSCDLVTGQCYCKANVIGRTCEQCDSGYFALSEQDFVENGCSHACACDTNGTTSESSECEEIGGNCACRANTKGRQCDECKTLTYGFGSSQNYGCQACDCDTMGTQNGELGCDAVSGQCACKLYTTSRRCDHCLSGYYDKASENSMGCTYCDCYPLGSAEDGNCDEITGQCVCKENEGDPLLGGRQCTAYISSILPDRGPESGGTEITVTGGYMGTSTTTNITIGNTLCPMVNGQRSATSLTCITERLQNGTDQDVLNVPQPVTVTLSDGTTVDYDFEFTFKHDPIIETVQPLNSILSGGIPLTVTGTFLDSVAFPYLEITMIYTPEPDQNETSMFDTLCTVKSDFEMICPTPNITLPENYQARARRKRQADPTANDFKLNSNTLEFLIGFRLDGVTDYLDLTSIRPDYSILTVYINPQLESFEGDGVKMYRTYWPFNDNHIVVQGERLNYGATVHDYTVTIGEELCGGLELTENRIYCIPPNSQPRVSESGERDGAPAFLIKVGNIQHRSGYLKYEASFWDNTIFRWSVIGGLILVVIVIVIIIVACCVCKHKRKENPKEKQLPKALDHFDHFDHFDNHSNGVNGHVNIAMHDNSNRYVADHTTTLPLPQKADGNAYTPQPPITSFQPTTLPLPPRKNEFTPTTLQTPMRRGDKHGSTSSYLSPRMTLQIFEVITPELKHKVEQMSVEASRLHVGKVIQEGKIGKIYSGMFCDKYRSQQKPVLIKTLSESGMVPREIQYFLEDSIMMRGQHHRNVLELLGLVIENNQVYSVAPNLENGNLKTFITNEENMLTVGELIQMSLHISTGLMFLSNSKVIHKDVAARNCVVDKDLIVKISDRALSRDLYPEAYWKGADMKRPMPIRWMSLENLEVDVFTSKSDVWAFAVTMWELLTRGCTPYPDVKSNSVKNFLLCGNRMDRPDFCPEELYALMLNCWSESPRQRPGFREITDRIQSYLDLQNTKTNLKKRSQRQVPSARFKGNNHLHLYNF